MTTSTAVSGGTGSMAVRRILVSALTLLAAPLLVAPLLMALSGCGGHDASVADPPIRSGSSSSPTQTTHRESPEHFIRRFYAAERALENTGDPSGYFALTAKCTSCDSLSHEVSRFYSAGGYVKWGGMHIQSIRRYSRSDQRQTFAVKGVAAPTTFKRSASSRVERLQGGPTTELVTVSDPGNRLRVVAFAKLGSH